MIASKGADHPLTVHLTRRFSIGGESDASLVLTQLYPQLVGADARGHLFIGVFDQGRVAEYDLAGHAVGSRGRKGAGPGEFTYLGAIGVGAGGDVWGLDYGKRALVGFDPDGKPLPQVRLPSRHAIVALQPLGETRFFLFGMIGSPSDTFAVSMLDGTRDSLLLRVSSAKSLPFDARKCGLIGQFERPIFAPRLAWAARGDTAAAVADGSYRIEVFVGLQRAVVLSRDRAPTPATAAMARRFMPDGWSIRVGDRPTCTIPTDELLAQVGVAPTVPAYSRLLLGPGGQLWAIRTTFPDEPAQVDFYTLRVGYRGTFTLGADSPAAFLSDGSVVMIGKDDSDVPVVSVYEVGGLQ